MFVAGSRMELSVTQARASSACAVTIMHVIHMLLLAHAHPSTD
jgi:hypothetical protein